MALPAGDPARSCFNADGRAKRRWETERAARAWLLERDIAYRQTPYPCYHCGWWHVRTTR